MGWCDAKQLAALGLNVSSWANVVKPINLGAMRSFNRAGIKSEAFGVALVHGADDAHNAGAFQLNFLKLRYCVKALG
jgi:hypothetical protein